jgi:hypothetical protein
MGNVDGQLCTSSVAIARLNSTFCGQESAKRRSEMKPFTVIAIVLFSLIAILQLARLILGWEVSVNGVAIPTWVSGVAFVAAGGVAVMLWRESRTRAMG